MRIFSLLVAATFFCSVSFGQDIIFDNNKLQLNEPVLFMPGTAEIKQESIATLHKVKEYLGKRDFFTTIRVEGHVSATTPNSDQSLSEQRALAVSRWLAANGVDCNRLLPVGFGNTKPVVPNDRPENKEKNSRIDFFVAALKGRPIGGMPVEGGGKVAGDACR